ncbi:RNA polymerase sigma-70 factor [Pedobacter gandavensis]|uniref:RNA polymerase sigma-70 factor n=1 Tax=Pedobacter gandavensis TaxID=2679963 RepID=UPI00292E20AB|nr:RNA polymerase sigma-70 factor [Pedobacter gandavensis]
MPIAEIQDEVFRMSEFREGADSAFVYFFKRYHQSLAYYSFRLVQDVQEAEDIVAECFFKLWQRRLEFEREENIKAFLYVACRNACLDYLRHIKVRSIAQQRYFDQLLQAEETILYKIIKAEVLYELNLEIELLPENYRRVFRMIFFDHKKTDEIANELGLTIQTIRNYKSRATELLKTSMIKKGLSGAMLLALMRMLNNP